MKATLEAINQMQAHGIIGKYAIGGAVGATFYLAPAATVDLDVFVTLPGTTKAMLVTPSPIYDFLTARGGKIQDEYIVLSDWPVQFLLPGNALETEAINEALPTSVESIPTRVMTAEHLVAIALNTGRAKDHGRILQFLEQGAVDQKKLKEIVERHGLSAKWGQFDRRFLGGSE